MKKLLLILFLGCLNNLDAFAHKVKGQIIFPTDTISVTFKIPTYGSNQINFKRLQKRIKYINSTGEKKILKPEDAVEVRFNYKNKSHRMVSLPLSGDLQKYIPMMYKGIFLNVLIDGKVKLLYDYNYSKYRTLSGQKYNNFRLSGVGSSEIIGSKSGGYIIKKNDGRIICPEKKDFQHKMAEYFADCPELVSLINQRKMDFDYLQFIINFYNKNCGKE
jgi:hypothetical protein